MYTCSEKTLKQKQIISLFIREIHFGARAHMLPGTVPIFLNFENASKKSEKICAETYSCAHCSCKFSTENINFCALCKKDKSVFLNSGLFTYFVCQIFVFFAQVAKIDIFCRKFTRVLNT